MARPSAVHSSAGVLVGLTLDFEFCNEHETSWDSASSVCMKCELKSYSIVSRFFCIQDLNRDNMKIDIEDLERWTARIYDAIAMGYLVNVRIEVAGV